MITTRNKSNNMIIKEVKWISNSTWLKNKINTKISQISKLPIKKITHKKVSHEKVSHLKKNLFKINYILITNPFLH